MSARPPSKILRKDPIAQPSGADSKAAPIRVMLVDDSLTVRTVFKRMIDREPDLTITATAGTAEQALMSLRSQIADVILLDLEMPGMGGLEALPKLLERSNNAQILVVSSLTDRGAEATLTALSMGAADTMLKPRPGGFDDEYRDALLEKVRALGGQEGKSTAAPKKTPLKAVSKAASKRPEVVAIGASTGGIHALNLFLRALPAEFDLPILITQHLPDSFVPVFARQIEMAAGRETVLADEDVAVQPNRIIIAPGNGHMNLRKSGTQVVTSLSYEAVTSGCMPSVDPMFKSCVQAFDGRVAAVLLSGMGRDGTAGANMVAEAGGIVLAQDEESCAVWGMPRTVSEEGTAIVTAPPEKLAAHLEKYAAVPAWQ